MAFIAASVVFLIPIASAPIVKDWALLKVAVYNKHTEPQAMVSFGYFGYCILDDR